MVLYDAKGELNIDTSARVERVVKDPFYHIYLKDHPYPFKGYATVEQVNAVNIVKELGKRLMKQAWHGPTRILEQFTTMTWPIIHPHIRSNLVPVARELQKMIRGRLGIIIAHVVEFDGAYRLRLQDMCSETTQEKLARRPIREIRRLLAINKRRDSPPVHAKLDRLAWLMCISLLIPNFRRQFTESIKNCDLKALQLDDADRYFLARRTDYRYNA